MLSVIKYHCHSLLMITDVRYYTTIIMVSIRYKNYVQQGPGIDDKVLRWMYEAAKSAKVCTRS